MSSVTDSSTFDRFINVKINDNGKKIECKPHKVDKSKKYRSAEDILKIQQCNEILEVNNEPLLTEEEADWMLDPIAIPNTADPEDLQKLAGFTVEKEIKYET